VQQGMRTSSIWAWRARYQRFNQQHGGLVSSIEV
jgi:hypothetical protein